MHFTTRRPCPRVESLLLQFLELLDQEFYLREVIYWVLLLLLLLLLWSVKVCCEVSQVEVGWVDGWV